VNHCTLPSRLSRGLMNRFAQFRSDESGAIIVFTLILFLLMVMMGGVAVDVMRYEQTRTNLQNTLDRCTLMAASIDQQLDAEDVVNDCVDKAGLADELTGIKVVQSINNRDVTAQALSDSKPIFLPMLGINKFDARAVAGAAQGITNVELALVLDVSGSMQGTKIANLKTAASEFVDTMLKDDTHQRVSISLVPYNGQVNLGPELRAKFTTTDNPNVTNMNCIDLPASVYSSSAMSQTLSMPMSGNVDTFSYASSYSSGSMPTGYADPSTSWTKPNDANKWCRALSGNVVRPMGNSISTLQSQINGLAATGATSINAGLKWGLALLDPSARNIITSLSAQGVVPASVVGRPFAYDDPDTLKVIVLMTDGENFAEERLNDGYRSGLSPIYMSPNGTYSIYHATRAGTKKYWVPSTGVWQTSAATGGGSAVQQDWQTIWTKHNAAWVAWQMYARANGTTDATKRTAFDSAMNAIRTKTETTAMDTQLQQICTQAKNDDVIVYGIAFEASGNGQTQIAKCASSKAHYFNATGLEISTAFRTIASNLTQLKLTQ
jgi:Flp pilus assembly protein TadG